MPEYYSTSELVEAYPALFSVSSLKKSRMHAATKGGPPFIHHGRKVAYARQDVDAWINALKNPTKQPPRARSETGQIGRPTKAQEIARRSYAG